MNNKVDKNKVIEMRQKNPCASLQKIGDRFGISRERVRQILNKNGERTRHIRRKYVCQNCGKLIEGKQNKLFCNEKCEHDYHYVNLVCEVCGKSFYRKLSVVKRGLAKHHYNHIFCGKKCQGFWLGSHYGKKHGKNNGKVKDVL